MIDTARSEFDAKAFLMAEPLPGMPETAVRLMRLAQDPDAGPAEFAVVIETDPGLTAQVLRFVNSSYFGFACLIASVKQAISLLGIRTIQNLVLWHAVFKVIPNARCSLFDLRGLWRDSLRRALFARRLGKLLGVTDCEEAFAAGLLQDMAIPLLAKRAPEVYSRLFYARCTSKHRVRLSDLETQHFGWNHAIAAGVLARKWHLPESLAALIQNHVALPSDLGSGKSDPSQIAVSMAAMLPADDDLLGAELVMLEDPFAKVRPADGPPAEELLRKADEEFAELAPLLQLPAPRTPLVDKYRQAMAAGTAACT